MHWFGKVVWSEGMFLRCQHFQQQDRYAENLVRETVGNALPLGWGVRTLELDASLLERGRIAVAAASGLLPDGTPFNSPKDQDPPPMLTVGEADRNQTIYLGAPHGQAGKAAAEVGNAADGTERFQVMAMQVADSSDVRTGSEAEVRVGHLRLRLLADRDDRSGFLSIPIARVQDVSTGGRVTLDPAHIPTCLDFRASARLRGFVGELEGLLHQRGDALAGIGLGPEQGTVGELANFMLLQVVNRYEPLAAHLAGEAGLHPEPLYRLFVTLAGELATFFARDRRPPQFERYRHADLTRTFEAVEMTIRDYLSTEFARRAVQIPLTEHPQWGLYTAAIHDRTLIDTAAFILTVSADLDPAVVGRQFPDQSKAGATEQIHNLVNLALPGIPLRLRPVAPRQIPYNAGAAYFELDKTSEHWRPLEQSGGLAFHVAGRYPNLKLELWAIRPAGADQHVAP